ncbi:MAG TPA: hypoxanthine phosphoribosyltransferase [Methanocorpusculum sp.]|nr:hypoxanthine phosphoribosyltransferase [Methanocorpusculum sp.]
MAETIEVLLSQETVEKRICEIAAEIDRDFAGKSVTLLCTLKGAVFFTCELAKHLTIPTYIDFIQTVSYSGTTTTGTVFMKLDVEPEKIKGQNVIIIEDVIDTGITLTHVKKLIAEREPAVLKVCTLLDKHECRRVPFEGDYIGFAIGKQFVVGYGLDVDQRYRNLPYVGILHQD